MMPARKKMRGTGVWDPSAGVWLDEVEAQRFLTRLLRSRPGAPTPYAEVQARSVARQWLELLVALARAPSVGPYGPNRISTEELGELSVQLIEVAPWYEDEHLARQEAFLGDLQSAVRRYLDDVQFRTGIEDLGRDYVRMVPVFKAALERAWNTEFILAMLTSARGFSDPLRRCDYCGRPYAKKREDQLHCQHICTSNHWKQKQPVKRRREWARNAQRRWRARKKE
jgi:hypothetical protein